MTDTAAPRCAEQHWEEFYREKDGIWSGRVNPLLVRGIDGLTAGTALDLGCGEGGDAVWLAGRGWRVTAVDISATALGRAQVAAAEAGVGDRIDWARHDLSREIPGGVFDLVSAQFLHSPVEADGERAAILRRAADLVAPGGRLVIGSHAGWPSWMTEPPHSYRFLTNSELITATGLDGPEWTVEIDEIVEREIPGPQGEHGHRSDAVLRARREGAPAVPR